MKHSILAVGCLLLTGLCWQVGAFDEDDLKKLLETNECKKCDLRKANLFMENLSGADLIGAILFRAEMIKRLG